MIRTKNEISSPASRWTNLAAQRLTNKQIFDLFDEFGMARKLKINTDYDWVRQNLPNKPEALKKVLKFEFDKENKNRRESLKTQNNNISPVENMSQSAISMGGNVGGYGGKGGPATPYHIKSLDEMNSYHPSQYFRDTTGQYGPVGRVYLNIGMTPETAQKKDGSVSGSQTASAASSSLSDAGTTYTPWSTSSDVSLVKFSGDPNGTESGDASTIWWVDHSTKTMRPIMSMQALQDIYDGDPTAYQNAISSINVLPPEKYGAGPLNGYIDLGAYYGIFERGQARKLDFNPRDLNRTYGKTPSEDNDIGLGIRPLNSFIALLSDPTSGINPGFLDELKNDTATMALYMNALAYGGYTPDDIYRDIKRKELLASGDQSMADLTVINSFISRDDWVKTNPGNRAQNAVRLAPPDHIGNVSRELWNSPAVHLNDEYYKLTDPEKYDPTSQAFRDALGQIKPAFYDYIRDSLEAMTEADKIIADRNWKEFRDEIEKTYGYKFHDNALEAWRQFEKLEQEGAEAGLSGSGVLSEKEDKMLRDYREMGNRMRDEKETILRTKEAEQARSAYSPEQIKKTIDEDIAAGLPRDQWRATKWGLVPKEEMSWSKFLANHRASYPDDKTTDEEIKSKFYDNLYDQYGNYRSTLYQNYQNNLSSTQWGFHLQQAPGTSEDEYKNYLLMQKRLDEEAALGKDVRKIGDENYWSEDKDFIDFGRELPAAESATTTTSPATTQTGLHHIKTLDEMNKYSPSQYFRDDEGKYGPKGRVYLKDGATPSGIKPPAPVVSAPVSPATPSVTSPYHIKSLTEMNTYDPSQYFRDTAGKYGSTSAVYLNQGLTPDTAKKVKQAAQAISSPAPVSPKPTTSPSQVASPSPVAPSQPQTIASPAQWVDPATGMATPTGVGMPKADYEKQKRSNKL